MSDSCPDYFPEALKEGLPEMDDALICEVSIVGTSVTDIHVINTEIGVYRAAVRGAHRLWKILQEQGELPGDRDDLARRIATARRYETLLRQRAVAARQARAGLPRP